MNGGNLRRRPERFCFLPDGEDETIDEINILSILKIRKQSQHPIFSPNPSASDQISPPKKKKDMEKGDRKMLSCLPVFFPCKKSTVILAWRQNLC